MSFHFDTVEVDKFNVAAARLLDGIIEKTMDGRSPGGQEHEFILRDGCVHIGRCYWDSDTPIRHPSQQYVATKLDIVTPGLLDCGGVGLASIQICQLIGAEIFATVGSEEKADYLVKNYGIPRSNIFHSRDSSFRACLIQATNGRGVDIVLNSLAGELLHASWDCVAPFGKMIELGKRDFLTNGMLSLNPFAGNGAFFGVDLLQVIEHDTEMFKNLVRSFESWYIEGIIKPIPSITHFDAVEVADAFRFLQRGSHIGKIVLNMPHGSPSLLPGSASQQSVKFSGYPSYLLVGGLGGVGRAVSVWMIENDARHLTYLSRSAGTTSGDIAFLQELRELGCAVECVRGSVASMADVRVFQMSLSLEDGPFPDMTYEKWKAAFVPKVQGTWNLHHAVAGQQLDFFVLFGSLVASCGRSYQVNYAAANSFLEAFSQYRQQLGLPCSVLSLGPIEEMGVISRDTKMLQAMRGSGFWMLSEAEVLEALQLALLQCQIRSTIDRNASETDPLVDRISAPLLVGLGSRRLQADSNALQLWGNDIRFSRYAQLDTAGSHESQSGNIELKKLLARIRIDPSTVFQEETRAGIMQELCLLIETYSVAAQEMDMQEKLQMQIDSLMSIEIRYWIRCNMQLDVSLPDIANARTFGGLLDLMMDRLIMAFSSNDEAGENRGDTQTK
ncbi:hypothetical protein FE257_004944 [Aspergillus nanangensis]|uniref:Uncharacterized protein n=1 Tax=Aspergillus nanangensis TaxID=2582783 RepID=A0AAD4CBL0_ASPNN|nr:hypothetical protein FE257_004944 [Aspergillus nanangensis]